MAKKFSGNDLCALCFLFVHPLVFNPRESKGKAGSISIEAFVFLYLTRKNSAASAYSAVDFFILGERRDRRDQI
jgi:hypothetical protein